MLLGTDIQQRSGVLGPDPFYDDVCELVAVFSHTNRHSLHLSLRWGTVGNENWDTDCPGSESPGGMLFLSAHCRPGGQATRTLCVSAWVCREQQLIQPQHSFFHFPPLKKRTNDPVEPSSHLSKAFSQNLSLASRLDCLNGPDPSCFWSKT